MFIKKLQSSNFIFNAINENIKNFKINLKTRFAPELSGYIHLGHLKNILINLDLAKIYNGLCNLRIDDSNPFNNKKIYKNDFIKNIKWLNKIFKKKFFKKLLFCSNYFHKFYQYIEFCKKKKLFIIRKIRLGFYKEKKILIKFKKIITYRIKYIKHFKTKYNWLIFPLYDWAHTLSDKIENINYSICSLEFIKNRKIYKNISYIIYKNLLPKQIEHSRLIIKNYITNKRIIILLIKNKYIKNKNDIRLLTINSIIKSKINISKIYFFLKNINLTRKNSIINQKDFEKLFFSKIYNQIIIKDYINIKIINYNKLVLFNTNLKTFLISNNLLINKNIFIKSIFKKVFFINNFKKFIKLKNLKIIICKNYIKNSIGEITIIECNYLNIKNLINNKEWINNKYKIKIKIKIKTNIIKNIKINKFLNTKSFKTKKIYLENITNRDKIKPVLYDLNI